MLFRSTDAAVAETILREGRADLIAMARELLWNADWPAHAARELGVSDPHGLKPYEHAFRLRQRERQKEMPINQGGAVTQAAYEKIFGRT